MTVIVCVDDKGGMMFNHRRQSQDSALRARILSVAKDATLRMNSYSARQFGDCENISVDEDFLQKASSGDFCFVEDSDILMIKDKIERLIVYKWNRRYPADTYLPAGLTEHMHMISAFDFTGTSHEKITEEVYEI